MPSVNELLDTVRERCNITSDNALAERLGVTRALISGWRKARYPIPDQRVAELCALAREDAPSWVARIHAERATSPAERRMWESVLDRLRPAAAVAGLALIGYLLGDSDAVVLAFAPLPAMHYANFAVALIAGFAAWTMLRRPAGSVGNRSATVGTSPGTRMDNAPSLAAA